MARRTASRKAEWRQPDMLLKTWCAAGRIARSVLTELGPRWARGCPCHRAFRAPLARSRVTAESARWRTRGLPRLAGARGALWRLYPSDLPWTVCRVSADSVFLLAPARYHAATGQDLGQ